MTPNIKIQRPSQEMPDYRIELLPAADLERSKDRPHRSKQMTPAPYGQLYQYSTQAAKRNN